MGRSLLASSAVGVGLFGLLPNGAASSQTTMEWIVLSRSQVDTDVVAKGSTSRQRHCNVIARSRRRHRATGA